MKPVILEKEKILKLLDFNEIILEVEKGFVAFSQGKAAMPSPQNIMLKEFNNVTHVKSAYIQGIKNYCIKIASGSHDNPKINVSSMQGLMILLDAKTGIPQCILLEDGELTNYRTAAAGAIAAKYLAKKDSENVLVLGTGIQAKLQLEFLSKIINIKKLFVWGRNKSNVKAYCEYIRKRLQNIEVKSIEDIRQAKDLCLDIIITTTPSRKPLVMDTIVKPGVHINAIGSDMPGKQELDENIVRRAKFVTDSTEQCAKNGELQHAISKGIMQLADVYAELGEIISGAKKGRETDAEITIFDSTGLGVQDLAIATYVFDKWNYRKK